MESKGRLSQREVLYNPVFFPRNVLVFFFVVMQAALTFVKYLLMSVDVVSRERLLDKEKRGLAKSRTVLRRALLFSDE